MKKLSVLAVIAAIGISGSAVLPVQAANLNSICEQLKTTGYTVVNGQKCSPEELKQILSDLNGKLGNLNLTWKDCPNITPPAANLPDTNTPDSGDEDAEVPDTETPDTETPDTETPDTPDTETPDTPDTGNPDTDKTDTDSGNPGTGTEERTPAEQVVDLVNAERAKAGLGALTLDKSIESAALVRAKEIKTSFSHTRPDGRSFSTVLTDNGISFSGAGENIAWGQRTPEEVMQGWMNSDGHRANILNSRFTKIGVGYYQDSTGRNHWTQLFTY